MASPSSKEQQQHKITNHGHVKHIFGISSEFKNNLIVLPDGKCVYASGARLIVYNPADLKSQQSYPVAGQNSKITSFTVLYKDTATLIICGVYESEKANIQIFEYPSMKRRKALEVKPEEEKFRIVSISASASGDNFAFLQSQEWNIIYWSLEKNKRLASCKVFPASNLISQQSHLSGSRLSLDLGLNISICPFDDNKMMVVGRGVVKTYRLNDGQIRSFQMSATKEDDQYNYVLWRSIDKAFICANNGRVIFVQHGESLGNLQLKGMEAEDADMNVTNITGFSQGIAVGDDQGNLYVFKKADDDKELTPSTPFELVRKVQLFNNENQPENTAPPGSCQSLQFSVKEESIFFATKSKHSFSVHFGNCASFKEKDLKISPVLPACHQAPITAIEASVWKPYVATLARDQTVCVWNYAENTCEAYHVFAEPVKAMSLHFMGIYMVVAYQNRIELLHVLKDGLRPAHDMVIKNISLVKFSNGGHSFAAVEGNKVHVFDTWTFELRATFVGHRRQITSLTWDSMDYLLITASEDGAIYKWSMVTNKRENEHIAKTNGFSYIANGPNSDSVVAVSTDNIIHYIDPNVDDDIVYDLQVSQCAMFPNSKKLVVATRTGLMAVVDIRSDESVISEKYQLSCSSVNCLTVSMDGKYVIAAADDGSITVVGFPVNDGVMLQDKLVIEEVLVSSTDLEEKSAKITELKGKAEELKSENDYQLHLKEVGFQEELKQLEENHTKQVADFDAKNQSVVDSIEGEKQKFQQEKSNLEKQQEETLKSMESSHAEKLKDELKRQLELNEQLEKIEKLWRDKTDSTTRMFETNKTQKEFDFNKQIQDKMDKIERLQVQLKNQIEEHDEMTKEIEEDTEEMLIQTRYQYELKLRDERENAVKYRAENQIMKKKHDVLVNEIETLQSEIQKLVNEEKRLQTTMKNLDRDIQGMEKEIKERDTAILEKEKRIDELKKKNQELEKFKSVLDYKLNELKREMEPREKEIQSLIKQLQEMDTELLQNHQLNNILELKSTDLLNRLKSAEEEIEDLRKKAEAVNKVYKKLQIDLADCVSSVLEPQIFRDGMLKIYSVYCQSTAEALYEQAENDLRPRTDAPTTVPQTAAVPLGTRPNSKTSASKDRAIIKEEITKQRDQLEKSLKQMKLKITHDKSSHRTENTRIMRENMMLIEEINQIRKDLKRKEHAMKMKGGRNYLPNPDSVLPKQAP